MSREMGDIIKVSKRLATGIFGKSIYCIAFFAIVSAAIGTPRITSWQSLLSTCSLAFKFNGNDVLNGSCWFFAYYLRAVFLNQLAIAVLKPYAAGKGYSEVTQLKCLLGINLGLFLMSCSSVSYLPIYLSSTDFLLNAMWLLGAIAVKAKLEIRNFKSWLASILVSLVGFYITARLAKADVAVVQNMKFATAPENMIPYFFFSLVSVFTTLYLRTKTKMNKMLITKAVAHVGKNAIFFFFAQGVSSLYIYNFLSWPMPNWWTRLLVMVLMNICISMLVAESMVWSEKLFVKAIQKIRIRVRAVK